MSATYRIVETDNFGADYPAERFVEPLPPLTKEAAERIAEAINATVADHHPRYWKVVEEDYVLGPAFEP